MTAKHHLAHLEAALIIGIGGFAGSNLRYFFELFVPSTLLATLAVNVLGCLALGFVLYEGIYSGILSEQSHLVLATGFISSFTTYSTFVVDAVLAEPMLAAAYVVASYTLGFAAVLVGRQVARQVAARLDVDEEAEPAATGGGE